MVQFPHAKSQTTCLLYKFVFKRYLDDSDFSNKQLECIHEEITNGVRLFARLKSHHRTIKIIHREQEFYCEVIPKPWSTPLYRFLFTDLSPEVAIPEEELVSIYNGLVEVARRLDKVRASRGLTYQAPEEPEEEVLYARAKKQDGAKLRTSDSPFAVLDNTVKERGSGSQLAPISGASKLRSSFRNRIRLTEFIKPYDGIKVSLLGSPSRKCDGKKLNRPLGVTFDEALEQWIVADTENNRVVMAPSGETLTSAQMIAPCAVAVIEPGHSFAVLTKYDIRIMYHRKDEWDLVVNHSGCARGLAITDSGNLLTMEKIKGYWNINVYEAKNRATLVNSCPYPKTPNGLPSFLDVHRDFVIITDLGTQSIMRFSIELGSDKMGFQECVCLGTGPTNRGHIEIKYISGVFIDDDQNILVADAKGRSLQMFNNRGIFLHAIKVTNGALPYISGIWVNKSGLIGACARAETNGGLYVYRIIMPPQSTHVPSLRR
ncbi:hypothetical protein Q1695_006786 [Nippostrongylus brasiliensis]|nr:hypothetical protein Q1695_006786 [Nippostrongylus brasiliensis]